MRVLAVLPASAYYTDFHLYCLMACRMAKVGMQHGVSEASPFALLGIILGPAFHRYSEGYRFAKLACDLVDKHGFIASRAKVYTTVGIAAPWTQPIGPAIDFMRANTFALRLRRGSGLRLLQLGPLYHTFSSCGTIRSTRCGARRRRAWTSFGKPGSKTSPPSS